MDKDRDESKTNFCVCGQIKHVGFDKCVDCLFDEQEEKEKTLKDDQRD